MYFRNYFMSFDWIYETPKNCTGIFVIVAENMQRIIITQFLFSTSS
jgi:hypothetical protein